MYKIIYFCFVDLLKHTSILTTDSPYFTQSGEPITGEEQEEEIHVNRTQTLEVCFHVHSYENSRSVESAWSLHICFNFIQVPRWRVKVYTSCYTMEGTENLDDDVYNKRHLRLENDERRRKRCVFYL